MLKSYVMIVSAAMAFCAVPAAAGDLDQKAGALVVSDLDLTNAKDVARFERRLAKQARALCEMDQTGTRVVKSGEVECRARAVANGRKRLALLVTEAQQKLAARLAP